MGETPSNQGSQDYCYATIGAGVTLGGGGGVTLAGLATVSIDAYGTLTAHVGFGLNPALENGDPEGKIRLMGPDGIANNIGSAFQPTGSITFNAGVSLNFSAVGIQIASISLASFPRPRSGIPATTSAQRRKPRRRCSSGMTAPGADHADQREQLGPHCLRSQPGEHDRGDFRDSECRVRVAVHQ